MYEGGVKMIAIIGAMDKEVEALLDLLYNVTLVNDQKPHHYLAKHQGVDIVIAKSGIGKVEAAYTVTSLLARYDIELVINIGSAGGLQPGQQVGDIVIGNSFMYHDLIFYYNDPLEGLDDFDYSSNPKNVTLMKSALDELKIRNWIGQIVSGDQFVSEKEQLDSITSRFPFAICAEMEATAIAHVCHLTNKEFIVIRSLSDIVSTTKSHTDFEKYLPLASRSSANACMLFLHKWIS